MTTGWIWVDALLVVVALIAGLSGFRHGAVASALALAGMLLGAIAGILLAPHLIKHVGDQHARLVIVVVMLVVLVLIGEVSGMVLGRAARGGIRSMALRRVDSVVGAGLHVVAILVVAWLLAIPIQNSGAGGAAKAVDDSTVLREVDRFGPDWLRRMPNDLNALLRDSGLLPEAVGRFGRTPVTAVSPPNLTLENSTVVRRVHQSVVRIDGDAPSCNQALEGSGFVVSPERVMTNAHVVAGTSTVRVETTAGGYEAKVVFFDPRNDIAVLDVPGMTAPALKFDLQTADSGDDAIALGYPEAGPYTASAERIRADIRLQGGDIYQRGTVVREVYTVRGVIRSGNSGGPLINPDGEVLGVVFGAAENTASQTGFVLTANQVQDNLRASERSNAGVDTQECVRE